MAKPRARERSVSLSAARMARSKLLSGARQRCLRDFLMAMRALSGLTVFLTTATIRPACMTVREYIEITTVVVTMRVTGKQASYTVGGYGAIKTVASTMVNGRTTKNTAGVF